MQQVYVTVLRDNQPLASGIVVQLERVSELEAMTYSASPYFRYDAAFPCLLLPGTQLQQNDYLRDELSTDYVSQQAVMYQVVNEPQVWPGGYTECKVDKVRL